MYSDAAELIQDRPIAPAVPASTHRWQHFPISKVAHHGQSCCEIAREWVVSMDFAQLNGSSANRGPRWLREKYEWGPSPWPIHWCEILGRKVIDCGAHSALAHEAFKARGLNAFRAQFVQRYSADALEQWRKKWVDQSVSDHWLADDVIYHEANAVVVGNDELKLWDSSAGWWLNSQQQSGYGSLVAVRILSDEASADRRSYRWGDHQIPVDEWYVLDASSEALG